MKNVLKNISKNIVLIGVLFLLTFTGYGQLQYADKETQRTLLGDIAKSLWDTQKIYSSERAATALTIALMQVPNTNTFICASNSQNFPKFTRDTNIVTDLLVQNGFNPSKVYFVSGQTQSTNLADYIYTEQLDGYDENITNHLIRLPEKKSPDGTAVNVHAEMTVLEALSVLYPNTLPFPKSDIVIMSDKNYCPRCSAYLSYNDYYQPSGHTHIQKTYTSRWSPPYYMNRANYNFSNWIRGEIITYAWKAIENGIVDGNGANILNLLTSDSPTGKYQINPQISDETFDILFIEFTD